MEYNDDYTINLNEREVKSKQESWIQDDTQLNLTSSFLDYEIPINYIPDASNEEFSVDFGEGFDVNFGEGFDNFDDMESVSSNSSNIAFDEDNVLVDSDDTDFIVNLGDEDEPLHEAIFNLDDSGIQVTSENDISDNADLNRSVISEDVKIQALLIYTAIKKRELDLVGTKRSTSTLQQAGINQSNDSESMLIRILTPLLVENKISNTEWTDDLAIKMTIKIALNLTNLIQQSLATKTNEEQSEFLKGSIDYNRLIHELRFKSLSKENIQLCEEALIRLDSLNGCNRQELMSDRTITDVMRIPGMLTIRQKIGMASDNALRCYEKIHNTVVSEVKSLSMSQREEKRRIEEDLLLLENDPNVTIFKQVCGTVKDEEGIVGYKYICGACGEEHFVKGDLMHINGRPYSESYEKDIAAFAQSGLTAAYYESAPDWIINCATIRPLQCQNPDCNAVNLFTPIFLEVARMYAINRIRGKTFAKCQVTEEISPENINSLRNYYGISEDSMGTICKAGKPRHSLSVSYASLFDQIETIQPFINRIRQLETVKKVHDPEEWGTAYLRYLSNIAPSRSVSLDMYSFVKTLQGKEDFPEINVIADDMQDIRDTMIMQYLLQYALNIYTHSWDDIGHNAALEAGYVLDILKDIKVRFEECVPMANELQSLMHDGEEFTRKVNEYLKLYDSNITQVQQCIEDLLEQLKYKVNKSISKINNKIDAHISDIDDSTISNTDMSLEPHIALEQLVWVTDPLDDVISRFEYTKDDPLFTNGMFDKVYQILKPLEAYFMLVTLSNSKQRLMTSGSFMNGCMKSNRGCKEVFQTVGASPRVYKQIIEKRIDKAVCLDKRYVWTYVYLMALKNANNLERFCTCTKIDEIQLQCAATEIITDTTDEILLEALTYAGEPDTHILLETNNIDMYQYYIENKLREDMQNSESNCLQTNDPVDILALRGAYLFAYCMPSINSKVKMQQESVKESIKTFEIVTPQTA